VTDLYETLGVDKGATQAEIKKSYWKKAMDNHPDKGGNQTLFTEISQAYAIISDPIKREYYDKHGKGPEDNSDKIINSLVKLFYEAVESLSKNNQYRYEDIINLMVKSINAEKMKRAHDISNLKDQIIVFKNIKTRLTRKGKEPNLFALTLDGQLSAINDRIRATEDVINIGNEMKKILKDYKYRIDEKQPQQQFADLSGMFSATETGTGMGATW